MPHIRSQDILSQEAKRNPQPAYAQLRSNGPLYYVDDMEAWVTTSYEDAVFLLKDPRFIKDRAKIFPPQESEGGGGPFQNLLSEDPPDHTRLRRLVSQAFTPRMIEQLRPRIQQITDELLGALPPQGSMDVIQDFAYPLPMTVICEMLGIASADRQSFRIWTQVILTMQPGEASRDAFVAFRDYIEMLLVEKRDRPTDDLASHLVQAREDQDQLSKDELVSMILLLIIAGHETTVNLIGTGTLALLQHPDQMQLLRTHPSLLPTAIEELLRYSTPVNLSDERFAGEDILLHDQLICKGEQIFIVLTSANADEQQFSNPNVLDITRQHNPHLAFGKGIHFCLGAPLARLEGQIAFGRLLQRLPNLRLLADPATLTWNDGPMMRGLTSLPVAF